MTTNRFGRRVGACFVVVGVSALAACSSSSSTSNTSSTPDSVVVVGLNNDQSRLLTEIYAQALEKAGFRVGRKDPVADLAAGYSALAANQADLFVTYTGQLLAYTATQEPAAAASTTEPAPTTTDASATTTEAATTTVPATTTTVAVTTTTAGTTPGSSADTSTTSAESTTTTTIAPPVSSGEATHARVTLQVNKLGEILPASLQFGAPSDAQDKDSIFCSNMVATTNSLSTFSELAGSADHLRLGAPSDFMTGDPFGLAGFTQMYGATFQTVVPLETGKVVDAITKGDVDCGVVNSLDVAVTADMSMLEDDLGLATDEAVVPLLSAAAATPGASQIIDSVSSKLLTRDLREMLRRVEIDKQAPNVVAGAWISAAGLAGK